MDVAKLMLTPLRDLQVSLHQIPAFDRLPNTSILKKPLLIYRSAFSDQITSSAIEAHLRATGVAQPQWRYTMYSTSHFHSTTHEVLCVARGQARLCFGGENNGERVEPVVCKGDVMIVPAGLAHRLLDDISGDFEMVGSYPKGHDWDMCYGRAGEEAQVDQIARLSWFQRDPVYGDEGPCLQI